jgi:hypothetical protein
MQFSDEILMAYADGEVDADTRRQIETAMASDPTIAERVAKHRALRVDLGAAFGGVLDEPVPSRLLDAANSTPVATRSATVTDLNAARAAKTGGSKPASTWSWPQWTAIAASLLIGVLAGRSDLRSKQSDMFATTSSGILATGPLSAALDDQMSGTAPRDTVQIGLTFQSKGGNYCRSFTAGVAAGFACREDNQWRVRALNEAGTHAAGGEYRMAGSELPPAILAAIDDVMEGEALDRAQEQAARERGWKK